jgi:hypothetical protein
MPGIPPTSRRRRRWLAALVLLPVGCVLALLGLEVLLRVTNLFGVNYEREFERYRLGCVRFTWDRPDGTRDLDGTLYRHLPDLDVDLGSFTLRTNAMGLRGPPIEPQKPPGTVRIVVLGDSVAFGWGVDDEVTFLRRWEAARNARADGRRYQVINTGHPMYDTTQEAALLAEQGAALDPDLVLLVYVVNDVEPTREVVEAVLGLPVPSTPEEQAAGGPDAWQTLAAFLRPKLPATGAMVGMLSRQQARYAEVLRERGVDYAPERFGKGVRGWERSKAALLSIRDWCRRAGVPLLILDHTHPPIRSLLPFCREHDIACADLRFTAEELGQPIYNSRLDPHANARGHELLLQKLEAAVAAAGVLAR